MTSNISQNKTSITENYIVLMYAHQPVIIEEGNSCMKTY